MEINRGELIQVIKREIEEARQINPVMALGMAHIQRVIEEYLGERRGIDGNN